MSIKIPDYVRSTPYYQFGERACAEVTNFYKNTVSTTQSWMRRCTSRVKNFALQFFQKIIASKIQRELPNNIFFTTKKQAESPKVGKYYTTNLRVGKTSDEGYKWKKELIRSATKSIELSANFAGGAEFRKILALIEERMNSFPELRTHILLNPEMLESKDIQFLKTLKKKFDDRFTFLIYHPKLLLFPRIHTEENHVKALVVDEKYFVVGGTSIHKKLCRETEKKKPKEINQLRIGTAFLDKTARDNDLIGEGIKSAGAIRRQFFNLFALCERNETKTSIKDRFFSVKGKRGICSSFHKKKELIRKSRVKVIVGGPEHTGQNPISAQYSKRITKAKKSITLANLEFFPEAQIRQALSLKRKKTPHIPIALISNSGGKNAPFGKKIISFLSRQNYKLSDVIYEYQQPNQIYHKKVGLFDDTHVLIGSYNLGKKSDRFDYEIACVVKDKRIARSFQNILTEDQERSRKIERSKIKEYSFFYKILYKTLAFAERFF